MDGQPFLYLNQEVDPGLIATLQKEVIPWWEANVPQTPEPEPRLREDPPAHCFTVVFDREGYSPEWFQTLGKKRIAVLPYYQYPREAWGEEEFQTYQVRLQGGEVVMRKLAERGRQRSNRMWVREIRKRRDPGHQTSILTTNFQAGLATVAAALFARWCQENFFRYMREHDGLHRLVEYGTEQVPDAVQVVNPQWRQLDSQIRSQAGQRYRRAAQWAARALAEEPDPSEMEKFQQRSGELRDQIESLNGEIAKLKQARQATAHPLAV